MCAGVDIVRARGCMWQVDGSQCLPEGPLYAEAEDPLAFLDSIAFPDSSRTAATGDGVSEHVLSTQSDSCVARRLLYVGVFVKSW